MPSISADRQAWRRLAHRFCACGLCRTIDAQRADNAEALRASLAQEVERKERALAQETAARAKAEQSLAALEKSKAVRSSGSLRVANDGRRPQQPR